MHFFKEEIIQTYIKTISISKTHRIGFKTSRLSAIQVQAKTTTSPFKGLTQQHKFDSSTPSR